MKNQFPSLLAADVQAGLALADELAAQLQTQMEKADTQIERPGGTNYLLPARVPKEVIAAILFYTIAAANHGWIRQS